VLTFSLLDNRIWFRNYQIVEEDGSLVEIGPRFCLNLIKIFDGSFGGPVLYTNPHYLAPNKQRMMIKQEAMEKYKSRLLAKKGHEDRQPKGTEYKDNDPYGEVFETIQPEKAKGRLKTVFQRNKI